MIWACWVGEGDLFFSLELEAVLCTYDEVTVNRLRPLRSVWNRHPYPPQIGRWRHCLLGVWPGAP